MVGIAPRRAASCILILTVTMVASSAPGSGRERPASSIPIAVADFDYTDASGERRNQEAEHAARLRAFVDALRSALEHDVRYRIVTIECRQSPCTVGAADSEVIERARTAGARLLLYGGIQKMSTLIQYAKVQIVDIEANKLVFDRLISFRGDTDESWRRAQRFLLDELKNANLASE